MPYVRKTQDEWRLQRYDDQYGWEDLCAYDNRKEAQAGKKSYRENQPGYIYRIIKKRIPIPPN